jgi:hypothetical protein
MYVYLYSQSDNLFTVGFYAPNGKWHPESDWTLREDAANRVIELNGGAPAPPVKRKGGYEPTDDDIEEDLFNREAGYES